MIAHLPGGGEDAACEAPHDARRIERLGHYASLRSSEDSSDPANLARESQFENLMTRIGEASSFLAPEIQSIDDATFAKFLADPVLADWQIPEEVEEEPS